MNGEWSDQQLMGESKGREDGDGQRVDDEDADGEWLR